MTSREWTRKEGVEAWGLGRDVKDGQEFARNSGVSRALIFSNEPQYLCLFGGCLRSMLIAC